MTTMLPEKIDRILKEVGVTDASAMDDRMEQAAVGTQYDKAARTKNSIFWTIYKRIFRDAYERYISDFRSIIPQLHHRYASGASLREHLSDVGLEEFFGTKSQYLVQIIKKSTDELFIYDTDIFYVEESEPKRYRSTQNYEFMPGQTVCDILVEAVAVGARYNLTAINLISACERALTVDSIGNPSVTPKQAGSDPETEEMMKDRISAAKGTKIRLGVEDYYLNVLKTSPGVVDATLDSITDDATMYFTIYGQAALSGETISSAQTLINTAKMATDKCVIVGATAYNLALTISIDADYAQSDINSIVSAYFAGLKKGSGYESSLLIAHIYSELPELKSKAIRISPDNQALPTGQYFAPAITYQIWGT